MTYFGENEYKGRHFIKKRSSGYKELQQGCLTAQGWNVDKKNYSRSNNIEEEQDNR